MADATNPAADAEATLDRRFEFLLNAFEHASQSAHPSANGYLEKRRALIDFVANVQRENEELRRDLKLQENDNAGQVQISLFNIKAKETVERELAATQAARDQWMAQYTESNTELMRMRREREEAAKGLQEIPEGVEVLVDLIYVPVSEANKLKKYWVMERGSPAEYLRFRSDDGCKAFWTKDITLAAKWTWVNGVGASIAEDRENQFAKEDGEPPVMAREHMNCSMPTPLSEISKTPQTDKIEKEQSDMATSFCDRYRCALVQCRHFESLLAAKQSRIDELEKERK